MGGIRRRGPAAPIAALAGLALGLLPPGGAAAAQFGALYRAYWAGLPAGEIRLTLREDAARYRDVIEIATEGLPLLVTRFRGTAVSEGRLAAAGPAPARYDARYDLRKRRDKRLSMRFVADPRMIRPAVIAERGPADSSGKPPLAPRFRTNVLDPLSALTAIRQSLRKGNRRAFSVPVYDGARRFDVNARVEPRRRGDPALRLELTLAPIAGFKGESSDDGDPDDAPRPVALRMSDDGRLMPLSMRVSLYYLPLVVELSRWCPSSSSCAW